MGQSIRDTPASDTQSEAAQPQEWAGSLVLRALGLCLGGRRGRGVCVLIPPQSSHLWSSQLLNKALNGDLNAVTLFNLKKTHKAFQPFVD